MERPARGVPEWQYWEYRKKLDKLKFLAWLVYMSLGGFDPTSLL